MVVLLCLCTIGRGAGRGHVAHTTQNRCQSPIDIITTKPLAKDDMPLTLTLWNTELRGKYTNTGHSVKFTPSNEGPKVTKGGQEYKVCQFHIHWGANRNEGSEHLINGKAYAGELHIVSVKDTLSCAALASFTARDDALVIGVFLTVVNIPVTTTIWQDLLPVPQSYRQTEKVSVQLDQFLPINRAYFYYDGSLTTEPYNEIVQWHVLKYPVIIPRRYLNQLRSTLDEDEQPVLSNFRNIQPLNERKISMCRSNKCITSR